MIKIHCSNYLHKICKTHYKRCWTFVARMTIQRLRIFLVEQFEKWIYINEISYHEYVPCYYSWLSQRSNTTHTQIVNLSIYFSRSVENIPPTIHRRSTENCGTTFVVVVEPSSLRKNHRECTMDIGLLCFKSSPKFVACAKVPKFQRKQTKQRFIFCSWQFLFCFFFFFSCIVGYTPDRCSIVTNSLT